MPRTNGIILRKGGALSPEYSAGIVESRKKPGQRWNTTRYGFKSCLNIIETSILCDTFLPFLLVLQPIFILSSSSAYST